MTCSHCESDNIVVFNDRLSLYNDNLFRNLLIIK